MIPARYINYAIRSVHLDFLRYEIISFKELMNASIYYAIIDLELL